MGRSPSRLTRAAITVATTIAVAITMLPTFAADNVCKAVDAKNVHVEGEIGRRIQTTVDNNLLVIDLDKDFLAPFQNPKAADGYVGLGKTIDAYARFAAYTGDKRVIKLKKHLVDETIKAQAKDGYLGMMRPESRIKELWDVHEMSYLVLGLTSDYDFCGEKKSLAAARKLADFLTGKLSATPSPKIGPDDLSYIMPTTGFDEAFLYLSEQTGDSRYRDFVINSRKLPEWRMPMTLGRWDKVEGHAYAYMCKCMDQIHLTAYMKDDPSLWDTTHDVFKFLLDGDGLVISGTCGDHECWHNTQSGTTNLGETCATAYLIRYYDQLIKISGNPLYGDLMERAIYNSLFGAQSPDGRHIRYYTPFEAPRVYHSVDTYCCPCNYRRILPALPGMIAYEREDGVYINLYAPSTAKLKVAGNTSITIEQQTDYPNSGDVKLILTPSRTKEFPLFLRLPKWAKQMTAKVNGENVDLKNIAPGLLGIRREWKKGDAVELQIPMETRLIKGRKTQDGRVAVMRGPIVFTYAPTHNAALKKFDPRMLTLDPGSIQGPFPDDSVHPGGMLCKAKVWEPGAWYPSAKTIDVTLTEFADPDSTGTYFLIPNPNDDRAIDDELIGTANLLFSASKQ